MKANRALKEKYDQIFKEDPLAANTFLLLTELADSRGRVHIDEVELARLLSARFDDPREYAL